LARCNAPPPDDQYLQLNQWRFDHEFSSWRSGGQSQYDSLQKIDEHMQVFGLVGAKFDAVNKVRGNRIILTLGDAQARVGITTRSRLRGFSRLKTRPATKSGVPGATRHMAAPTTPEACRA
jgi:single-stranded DNA-specific DHH superfamily exonuclease